jgi:phosphatidylglycerophosphate synthase
MTPQQEQNFSRREIKSRDSTWAKKLATFLTRLKVSPNLISIASALFALLAGALILSSARFDTEIKGWIFLLSMGLIQLRLICNLLDGMVAVEGGLKTKTGDVFNDLPDRYADVFIIIPLGYIVTNYAIAVELAWLAGLAAVFTAYIRVLGGACGLKQAYLGPMAKQHRMAVISASLLIASFVKNESLRQNIFLGALLIIILGCVVTIFRRTKGILRALNNAH